VGVLSRGSVENCNHQLRWQGNWRACENRSKHSAEEKSLPRYRYTHARACARQAGRQAYQPGLAESVLNKAHTGIVAIVYVCVCVCVCVCVVGV
jgi:hypothetical protein